MSADAGPALRLGTRGSPLAIAQAGSVADAIPGAVELVPITTSGDRGTGPEDKRRWVDRIDDALLSREIDLAVHSAKDVPGVLAAGLELAGCPTRADALDCLCGASSLAGLASGARVGTSSLRRRAFLTRARPDLKHAELRGNVPTRVERLAGGDYDAIILAAAGLARLGLLERVSEFLSPDVFAPAVSQGIIGICARTGDGATLRWLLPLDDREARLAASAERALLHRIEGGCQVPLGALATVTDRMLRIHACVCALDGSRHLSAQGAGPASIADATSLGERVADELLARGAGELIARERGLLAVAAP